MSRGLPSILSTGLIAAQSPRYRWWAFGALAIGLFTSVADHGSSGVALPTIAGDFGTDLPTTQWVIIGYALTISALLLPMGRLADIVGRKRVYVAGFVVFVSFAALSGAAANVWMLILFRVLMGVGAAMTQGTSMAMVISAFPDSERGKALGMQMSIVGVGGVAGPAVGGLIVSAVGWRGVYFTTAMMGVLAIIAAVTILDGRRAEQERRGSAFDWLGATLSTAMLVVFLLTMSSGPNVGWGSPPIVAAFGVVLLLLGAFVWWELHTPSPMLDVRLFGRKLFLIGVSASFISFVGMASVRFLTPFYLQVVLGYSPREVGLMIVPAALAMVITGPLGGRLSDRYGWTKFNVGGLLLSAAGLFMLSRLGESSSPLLVVAAIVIQSSGTGVFNAPNNSSVLSAVEPQRYGVISAFLNLVRNSGNVTGTAIATAIVTGVMASMGYLPSLAEVTGEGDAGLLSAFTSGLQTSYLWMAGLILVGAAISVLKGARPQVAPQLESSR